MSEQPYHQKRVLVYVDGFNLYFGMKDSGWQRYYWLNVEELSRAILPPDTSLIGVKYFTSYVISPEEKRKRQNDYLEALRTVTACQMYFGKYQFQSHYCENCDHEERVPKEKMTDVNIAVEMMADAFENRFDIALLISGDSDLTPPIIAVRRLFPDKSVIVAFPPKRHADDLKNVASSSFVIARAKLRDNQLPEEIKKADGYILTRPDRWR